MKKDKERIRASVTTGENKLKFRKIGKGFIMVPTSQEIFKGRRLITAYADQHNRSYVLIDGKYELITEQHSYLSVD